jgi:hypothetical protein
MIIKLNTKKVLYGGTVRRGTYYGKVFGDLTSEEEMFHTRANNLYLRNLAVPAWRGRGNLFYPLHRRHLHDKGPALPFKPVLRIRDILVRILIRESVPLTFGFEIFFKGFLLIMVLFVATFASFFKNKK